MPFRQGKPPQKYTALPLPDWSRSMRETAMNTLRNSLFSSKETKSWLRVVLSMALGLVLVWVLAPGIASVWAGSPFEATAAAFLLAFLLFAPLSLFAHLLVFTVSGQTGEENRDHRDSRGRRS